jgi:basic membrane protein A
MRSNNLLKLMVFCVIAAIAIASCATASTPTTAPESTSTAAPAAPVATQAPASSASGTIKVAMVTSGPTNDQGWNYDALRGIQQIKAKFGWDYAYSESVPVAQQQNVLRQYAQQGYNLIFAHGYEWGDALTAVAKDFPNVMFVQINATTAGDNIVGTAFKYGELGYFTGMAAGLMTKNNKIGVVAAQDAPQVTADSDMMKVSAKLVNPNADVNVSFVGSWDDVVKGQQVVQAQIDRGVDILIIMGNAFTPPAIKLAKEKGIKVIPGWTIDGYSLGPDTVIVSAVQDIPGVYLDIAQKYKDGTLKGNTTDVTGFKEHTQLLGKWGDFVPQTVKDKVNNAVDDYIAGKLDIGIK